MKLAPVLRALLLALLAAALLLPDPWRDPPASARTFRVTDRTDAEAIARAALAALPDSATLVAADAPLQPRAGRAAAIPFRVRAGPRRQVTIRLADAAGALDSVRLRTDEGGRASGAFRVRPARSGWREWSVDAGGRRATAGAWVDTAGAPRVLVRAGLPGWEARFVVRALEESGARVDVRFDLGRGMAVGQGAGDAITPARLAAVDAVLVLDGAPLGAGEASTLSAFAARGGGVLVAGDRAAALGTVRAGGTVAPLDAASIRWTAPAEIAPLPTDSIPVTAVPFAGAGATTVVAASSAQGGLLALRPFGRGRAASLALTDSWRWRMEGGRIDEHREFWRGLVDWLASAPRDPLTIRPAESVGAVGVRQEVAVFPADGAAPPPSILLARPGAAPDTLPLATDPARPSVLRASFVPADDGVHALTIPNSAARAGFRALRRDSADAGWARLAAITHSSGGAVVPRSELDAAETARTGDGDALRLPLAWMILGALVVLAGAEWTIRRLAGRG